MKTNIAEAICQQIGIEFDSAYLYLALSADMAAQGYRGAAHWLRLQYREECEHALRLIDYLEQRSGTVRLSAIPAYLPERRSLAETFRHTLEHERAITTAINKLLDLCVSEKDYASQHILLEYAAEQVQEENAVTEIVDYITLCEGNTGGLMRVDARLGERRE